MQSMATVHPLPAPVSGPPHPHDAAAAVELAAEKALVAPVLEPGEKELLQLSRAEARLPVELDVSVSLRQFRVRNLLALRPGQVIETTWNHGSDVPLAAGDVQLAWSEFEVIDSQLAVRITRLA
jgi:flagellar motor switch protein FliM